MSNKVKRTDENAASTKPGKPASPAADSHKSPDLSKTIEKLAYERWLSRGGVHGDDWSDWFEAERLL